MTTAQPSVVSSRQIQSKAPLGQDHDCEWHAVRSRGVQLQNYLALAPTKKQESSSPRGPRGKGSKLIRTAGPRQLLEQVAHRALSVRVRALRGSTDHALLIASKAAERAGIPKQHREHAVHAAVVQAVARQAWLWQC